MVWAGRKAEDPPAVVTARAAMLDDTEDEYRRLLYVAMTRAADRLIVGGCMPGNRKDVRPSSWYDLIAKGLERAALFAQAGIPLARDGQAAFGDARLLAKPVGARPQNIQAFVERRQPFVERLQRLLAGQALAFRLLRRRCGREQIVVGLATRGVGANEPSAV